MTIAWLFASNNLSVIFVTFFPPTHTQTHLYATVLHIFISQNFQNVMKSLFSNYFFKLQKLIVNQKC